MTPQTRQTIALVNFVLQLATLAMVVAALVLLLLSAGCAPVSLSWKNERHPERVLEKDWNACLDWAATAYRMPGWTFRSMMLDCMGAREWHREVVLYPEEP